MPNWNPLELRTTVKFTQAKWVQVLGFTWFHRQISSRWRCFFSVELDYNFIPWICGSNVHQTTTNVTYLKKKHRCVLFSKPRFQWRANSAHISWVDSDHKPSEKPSDLNLASCKNAFGIPGVPHTCHFQKWVAAGPKKGEGWTPGKNKVYRLLGKSPKI